MLVLGVWSIKHHCGNLIMFSYRPISNHLSSSEFKLSAAQMNSGSDMVNRYPGNGYISWVHFRAESVILILPESQQ